MNCDKAGKPQLGATEIVVRGFHGVKEALSSTHPRGIMIRKLLIHPGENWRCSVGSQTGWAGFSDPAIVAGSACGLVIIDKFGDVESVLAARWKEWCFHAINPQGKYSSFTKWATRAAKSEFGRRHHSIYWRTSSLTRVQPIYIPFPLLDFVPWLSALVKCSSTFAAVSPEK